jgi:hypothetical protein
VFLRRLTTFPRLAVLVGILFVVNCGGNGDDPNNPSGNPPPISRDWDYAALGDSLAFGVAALQGYVPRYAEFIRTDTQAELRVFNLGVPGCTSSDLLNALRNDASLRNQVMNAEVVTFECFWARETSIFQPC